MVHCADSGGVVRRALITCAYVCCGLVLASFLLFALDQASGASKHQVAALTSPSSATPKTTPAHPGEPRAFIDGAAKVLTGPFHSIIHPDSTWTKRIFEMLCAMLVYGFGLGYLARYSRGLV
jgi:hypothetical protein